VAELLEQKSDFIDQILSCCCQHFLGDFSSQLALCAVGGYGRRELFPYSDIDIVLILTSEKTPVLQNALANFFTFLWDIGLKPSLSVRTIAECVTEPQLDQTIMTSLMEIRLIIGSTILFEALKAEITPDKVWPAEQFFIAKMQEQQQRYLKYHDTAYYLEPNIKEGPGGLRDLHVIAWVFKRQYDTSTLRELTKFGFLPEERAWMTKLLHTTDPGGGLIDVYRRLQPTATDTAYTWWSNRGQAYANNVGWRLDYHLATPALASLARAEHIYKGTKFSDHAPITVDYAFTL